MIEDLFLEEYRTISILLDRGDFSVAFDKAQTLLNIIEESPDRDSPEYYLKVFNLAGAFIDIGSMKMDIEIVSIGFNLMNDNQSELLELLPASDFYYNFANAKSGMISEPNPFAHTFESVEDVVQLKCLYWKAIKATTSARNEVPYELTVNLANSLKQQFRLVEALRLYDKALSLNLKCAQAWVNRSETLLMLNTITSTHSLQMLDQIVAGYIEASKGAETPDEWAAHYLEAAQYHQNKIEEFCLRENISRSKDDSHETKAEFNELSDYRKFCLQNHLSLSEHGLYCHCAGSARDNLTIPNVGGVVGDFIVPMEMVLNRLKSEFSFARKLYYEYLTHEQNDDLLHESCFSELFNDELLGIDVEKLRTSFRLCFGILDKIGVATCELFDLYPPNGNVSFQSFWQLDRGGRRARFEAVKSPGLLALYSIASDLNDRKDGEWAFFKAWRNDLEHKFVVVHKEEKPNDLYSSYRFVDEMAFIKESDFINFLEHLLQITRSAIFSFTLMVRHEGEKGINDEAIMLPQSMHRQDFKDW
ncbi:LA2681 family HEPN domain-containing protein [Vibrio lentus]|nr:LA2681 family HEPN domain-containing protein [Vibrio lentus]